MSSIRRILALIVLLVFSFSITPKSYWHDLLAGHTDVAATTKADGQEHVNKSGFQCDCNSLVATSPYTDYIEKVEITGMPGYQVRPASMVSSFYSAPYHFIELRGPPQIG